MNTSIKEILRLQQHVEKKIEKMEHQLEKMEENKEADIISLLKILDSKFN